MKRIQHTESFEIDQNVDELFPLFSAEGEKYWVPGWDYTNIMGSAELHEDYVFLTQKHGHALSDAIWLVKRHEPESHYIELYKIEPEFRVGTIKVKCESITESSTRVTVTYGYISLSDKGNKFIDSFTDTEYKKYIGEWKRLLEKYFSEKR